MLRICTAALLGLLIVSSNGARAMPIVEYDKMAVSDQSDFIAALIEGVQQLLLKRAQNGDAAKVHTLFTEIKPGNTIPTGMQEFETYLANVRVLDAERYARSHDVARLEVEQAMTLTLRRNGVSVPPGFMDVADGFRPKLPLK